MKNYHLHLLLTMLLLCGWSYASGGNTATPTAVNDSITNCRVYISPSFSTDCILTDYDKSELDSIMRNGECIKACKGNTVQYEAVCDSAISYTWTITGDAHHSTTNNGRKVNITWGDNDYGSIRVEVLTNDSAFCATENCVILIESPSIGSTSIPAYSLNNAGRKEINVCLGESIEFIDQSVAGRSPIISSTWEIHPLNDVSHSKNFTFTPTDPTINQYHIKHTIINECGCIDHEPIQINILPPANLQLSCYGTACAGSTQEYQINNPTCNDYFWHVQEGNIINGQGTPKVTVQWGNPESGYGIISIDGGHCTSACKALLSTKIPIISNAVAVIGPNTVCINEEQMFEMPLWGSTDYLWTCTPNTGVTIAHDNRHKTIFKFTQPGTYQIYAKYNCPFLNCGEYQSLTKTVVVRPPLAIESNDDVVCINTAGSYTTNDTNSVTWKVYNPQKQLVHSATTDTLFYTFTSKGSYSVTARNNTHCNTANFSVTVKDRPPALTHTEGPHEACRNSGILLSAKPTSPMYYLSWEPTCQAAPQEADSVTIMYDTTFCNVNVYQIDKETECRSEAFVHTVSEFQLQPLPLDTIYGCPGQTIDIDAPDQSYSCTYRWTIDPAYKASITGSHLNPHADVWLNHTNNNDPFHAIVKRKYCEDYIAYDTIHIAIGIGNITPPTITPHDTAVCPLSQITFTAEGDTASPLSYSWRFNGMEKIGQSVSFNAPEHNGIYSVMLTYKPNGDCDSIVVVDSVTVLNPPNINPINFSNGVFSIYSSSPNVSYEWTLDGTTISTADTCPYQGGGIYCCTITSNLPPYCSSMKCYDARDCDSLNLSLLPSECPHIIRVVNNSNPNNQITQWSCNDPSASINYLSPSSCDIIFNEVGDFTIYASLTDNGQCYNGYISYKVSIVPDFEIKNNCDGSVTILDKTQYLSNPYDQIRYFYTNSSHLFFEKINPYEDSIIVYANIFPNNIPTTVTMKFEDFDCLTTKEFTYYPLPSIRSINIDTKTLCGQTPHLFHADAPYATTYHWNFGDSATNYGNNIYHTYGTLSDSLIDFYGTLTVTNPAGCIAQDSFNIKSKFYEINGNIQAELQKYCSGIAKTLSYIPKYIANYYWTPYNISTGSTNQYTIYETNTYGTIVTDTIQCKGQEQKNISFYTTPKAQILSKENYCHNEEVKLIGNTGSHNTYRWTLSHNNTPITLPDSTAPNLIFTPSLPGTYSATLQVNSPTPEACPNSSQFSFNVYPPSPAPSIAFGNNRCIHEPPVNLSCTSGQSLLWSNGERGTNAKYYNDGIISAYYIDSNGCPSTKATKLITPQPNFDALLTGCYKKCKNDIPNYLLADQLYHYNTQAYYWHWDYQQAVLDSGYSTFLDLPLSTHGDYQLFTTYDTGCVMESPILSIQPDPDCDCPIEVTVLSVKEKISGCKATFEVSIKVSNNNNYTVTINSINSVNNNVYIQSNNLPVNINAYSSKVITFDLNTIEFNQRPIEIILEDKTLSCHKKFLIDIPWEKYISCHADFEDVKYTFIHDLSTHQQTQYFQFNFILQSSTLRVLDIWSDPAQLIIVQSQGSNRINGLYMIDYAMLVQLAQQNRMICFYAVVCDNDKLCKIKYCIPASLLLKSIPEGFTTSSTSTTSEAPLMALPDQEDEPTLIPNPAIDQVTIGNLPHKEIDRVTLYDMNGRKLRSLTAQSKFSVADLPSGLYIVSIITFDEEAYFLKLVKR